jgi:hypothetical protein
MVVLFVPRSLLHGDEGEIGPDVVRHLVGVELSSSFAVAATSVAREQRPAGSTQLPAELLQTILDRVDPPPGWPTGALRVLAEIRGTASGQGGAGVTAEPDLAGIRLCMRFDGSTATYVSLSQARADTVHAQNSPLSAGSARSSSSTDRTPASTTSSRSTRSDCALRRPTRLCLSHSTRHQRETVAQASWVQLTWCGSLAR